MNDAMEKPTTLLQQGAALRERMSKVQSSEANEQTIRVWEPLRSALPEYLVQMERLLRTLRLLHSRGLLPPGRTALPKDASGLTAKLADLRDRLLNRPDKVMQKNGWANTEVQIKAGAKALERVLAESWKAHLSDKAPKLDDWLPFFEADRFGAQIRQVKTLRTEFQSMAATLPIDAAAFALVEEKSAEIRKLVEQLDFGNIPPAVKKLVTQLMSFRGTTLADIDVPVLEWLHQKGLAAGFRLTLGGR